MITRSPWKSLSAWRCAGRAGLGCGLGVNTGMMGRMGVEDKSVDKYEIKPLGCKMTQAMSAFQQMNEFINADPDEQAGANDDESTNRRVAVESQID